MFMAQSKEAVRAAQDISFYKKPDELTEQKQVESKAGPPGTAEKLMRMFKGGGV